MCSLQKPRFLNFIFFVQIPDTKVRPKSTQKHPILSYTHDASFFSRTTALTTASITLTDDYETETEGQQLCL